MHEIESIFRPLRAAFALIVAMTLIGNPLRAQDTLDGNRTATIEEATAWLERQRASTENVRLYRQSAEHGDANAQLQLGRAYVSGSGVPQDPAEGIRWIRLAADQGHADAQNALASAYSLGRGVLKDESEAARWLRRAAKQGHTTAQILLARRYIDGRGVIKDVLEAERWYLRAAEQGHTTAQFFLAEMYIDGHGAIKDVVEGARWYRRLAEEGDGLPQYRLGLLYQSEDALKNYVLAHMWFNVASASGLEWAGHSRDQIEISMTREEIFRATNLARDCLASEYKNCGT